MAENGPFFGDTMTLTVDTEAGTSIPIGSLQAVEIRVEANENEYFSADTTKREAVQHTERVPVVTFTVGAWDDILQQHWLGGSGTSSTGLVDTSDPQKFDIVGSVTPVGGSTKYEATVTGVTIPTLPIFSASRNEYLGEEFEGRGDDIDLTTLP